MNERQKLEILRTVDETPEGECVTYYQMSHNVTTVWFVIVVFVGCLLVVRDYLFPQFIPSRGCFFYIEKLEKPEFAAGSTSWLTSLTLLSLGKAQACLALRSLTRKVRRAHHKSSLAGYGLEPPCRPQQPIRGHRSIRLSA